MIYVSKIGETIRYPLSDLYAGEYIPKVELSAACKPCRTIAKRRYPTMGRDEPVRCYHVAVKGTTR